MLVNCEEAAAWSTPPALVTALLAAVWLTPTALVTAVLTDTVVDPELLLLLGLGEEDLLLMEWHQSTYNKKFCLVCMYFI